MLNCCCQPGVTARDVYGCMYEAVTNAWFVYDREKVLFEWAEALCASGLLRHGTPFADLHALMELLDHGLTAWTGLPSPVKHCTKCYTGWPEGSCRDRWREG